MNLIDYAKAYASLALYIMLTRALGMGFWNLGQDSRPLWLIGALLVLVVAVYWRRAPERRSRERRF